jgi:hypothetical protein
MCDYTSRTTKTVLAKAVHRIMILRLRSILPIESLETQLENAQPAEDDTPKALLDDTNIRFHRLANLHETNDGMWRCHHGHENPLIHFKGPYPFKYLSCEVCDHILCRLCDATEILTVVDVKPAEIHGARFLASSRAKEMRYCSVCKNCGLSHRAKMKGGHIDFEKSCPCGQRAEGDEVRGFIGSAYVWRRDPVARAVELSLERFRRRVSYMSLDRSNVDLGVSLVL